MIVMAEETRSLTETLKEIEKGLSLLEQMWSEIQQLATDDHTGGIQEITMRLSSLRETIDQVEIRLTRVEGQVSEIESMRFRIRSGL